MTWIRARWAVLAAGLALVTVAAVAGIVSYRHIELLTLRLHQSPEIARLMPFAVDGLMVVGSVILLDGAPVDWWLGWLGIGPGLAASLFATIQSGLPYGWLSATWAAVPSGAFFLATFMLERWLKAQAGRVAEGGPEVAPADAGTIRAEVLAEVLAGQPRPCGHEAPATIEDAVINTYLHRRDCLGEAPSQRAIAASFDLSRQRVAELVGPLNGHGLPATAGAAR